MLFCDQKQSNGLQYMVRLCHLCCWSVGYCDMCLHMQTRYLCQVYRTDVIGIWTLMCSLLDESVSQSMYTVGHSVVHVNLKCPLGITRPITLKFNCNVRENGVVQRGWEEYWHPNILQMLTYGMHFFCSQMSHSTIISCRMDLSLISRLGVLVVQDLIQVWF